MENFRAGALERLGLGYADLCAVKPDIIYCSITGFGQTRPKRGLGAFDNVIQAWSGMMTATGHPDQPPVMVGPPVADYGTGAQAAFAIASALLRRERTAKATDRCLHAGLGAGHDGLLGPEREPDRRAAESLRKRQDLRRRLRLLRGLRHSADDRGGHRRQNARLWRALGRKTWRKRWRACAYRSCSFGCSVDGPAVHRGPPEMGEHRGDPGDLGYGPEDVSALEREGVV